MKSKLFQKNNNTRTSKDKSPDSIVAHKQEWSFLMSKPSPLRVEYKSSSIAHISVYRAEIKTMILSSFFRLKNNNTKDKITADRLSLAISPKWRAAVSSQRSATSKAGPEVRVFMPNKSLYSHNACKKQTWSEPPASPRWAMRCGGVGRHANCFHKARGEPWIRRR